MTGRAWMAVLSSGGHFKLAETPKMQMRAEGCRKVEMKRAGVPRFASKLFTYFFSAYNPREIDKSKDGTRSAKEVGNGPRARRQGFAAEEGGARVQHVTILFLGFNHFEISSLTGGK